MRILHVGKYYFPSHGGIETALRNLAEGLVQAGDEVTVLCSSNGTQRTEEWINQVRVIRVPHFGTLFSQPISPSLPVELKKIFKGYDLVNVHTPNPLSEVSAMLLPPELPIVVTYHSDIVRQKAFLPIYGPLLRFFLKSAQKIVVSTQNQITHSPFLRGFQDKCEIIPYGIDSKEFEVEESDRKIIEEQKKRFGKYILFVGRLVGYKGVSTLLEAMVSVSTHLVIAGDGVLRYELEQTSRELGIQDRVHFLGGIADSKRLTLLYHGCECLVLPSISKNEAFGLVQVEAMACGKPLITTRLDSGVTEVNQEGVTGYHVKPGNPEELGDAINDLLSNENKKLAMGKAARKRFEENYTREKMVTSYRNLYLTALNRVLEHKPQPSDRHVDRA